MAFLDNSGDIILDAVLTDHGRQELSKGDGSFRISKFALGDEEINYASYNFNHPSGSAYYDLEILQTPVLESFTNNASSMKTKLFIMDNMNLLYLPVLKINPENPGGTQAGLRCGKHDPSGAFLVAVDEVTEGKTTNEPNGIGFDSSGSPVQGIMLGQSVADSQNGIRVDQGLDTTEVPPTATNLIADLIDSSYIVQMDSRLGTLITVGNTQVGPQFIDDDSIASYMISTGGGIVATNNNTTTNTTQIIKGPRGTFLNFKIGASLNLQQSTYLFTQLGGTTTLTNRSGASQSCRFIDTMVRITGMSTGYTIDIPVRFVKIIQ